MNNTAIDLAIEQVLVKEQESEGNDWLQTGFSLTLDILRTLKHDEERQIKEAYNQGYRDAETDLGTDYKDDDVADHENAQIYFDETYNKK